jgi:hypothetical protein
MLLGFWRANVIGSAEHQQAMFMKLLDGENLRRLHYLVIVAAEFGLT